MTYDGTMSDISQLHQRELGVHFITLDLQTPFCVDVPLLL